MLGTSSFPAKHEVYGCSVVFPHTSCLAGNELVPCMTKNTASEIKQKLSTENLSTKQIQATSDMQKFRNIIVKSEWDLHLKNSPWPFINYAYLEKKIKIWLEPVKKNSMPLKMPCRYAFPVRSHIVCKGPQSFAHCVVPVTQKCESHYLKAYQWVIVGSFNNPWFWPIIAACPFGFAHQFVLESRKKLKRYQA